MTNMLCPHGAPKPNGNQPSLDPNDGVQLLVGVLFGRFLLSNMARPSGSKFGHHTPFSEAITVALIFLFCVKTGILFHLGMWNHNRFLTIIFAFDRSNQGDP
jgi:hypothetical protein